MSRGASKVVNTCMKVQPGEQILIVTELSRLSIAQALAAEVYRVGAEPAMCIMEPRTQDSQEPPKEIAAAMLASDDSSPWSGSPSPTPRRSNPPLRPAPGGWC